MLLNLVLILFLNTNHVDLNEVEISPHYNPHNILEISGINSYQLWKITRGTGLEGLEEYYIRAERETGVNAIYLTGLSAVESAWGTSNIFKKKGNLFAWMARDKNPMKYAKNFKEHDDSGILSFAISFKETYLVDGGTYYNGADIVSVSKHYCPPNSVEWVRMINGVGNKAVRVNTFKLKELF